MQKILTQLIKEKELPRALQWCRVSTEQRTYLGENLRKPPCTEKGSTFYRQHCCTVWLITSMVTLKRQQSGVLIISSSLVQLLGCGMC